MVSILHISDLHIIEDAAWNNMSATLLEEVRKKTHDLPPGKKLLIITGDFHNFYDNDYKKVETFLQQLFDAMDIEPDKDVFVVPGNHDVANSTTMDTYFGTDGQWKMRQKSALSGIKNGDQDFMEWRLESFSPYCKFVQNIGIYSVTSKSLAAEVHVRNWRKKLNILHLNTALIADGTSKAEQQVDIDTATHDQIWESYYKNTIPTLVIGHNSFFDLKADQQIALTAMFERKNVSAYLCGDRHIQENDRNRQMIRLKSGLQGVPEIPNIICMKCAADYSDKFSQFGFYWHYWDEETNKTTLDARIWKRDQDQSKFISLDESGFYTMQKVEEADTHSSPVSAERTANSFTISENKTLKLNSEKQIVQNAYFDYLLKELGTIQFDGIPTDKDSGTVKAELEHVFVPLRFQPITEKNKRTFSSIDDCSIGDVLSSSNRVAILAKPGGGKSTLIRRIALAYAYPERKEKVNDDLPDSKWFPIYIRCRDFGDTVQNSIIDIIFSIVNRAELSQYKSTFVALIEEQLQTENVLLLIDGLDEISNEQYRIRFVNQLYTFVTTYPKLHLLITSRETGFRAVAQKLGSYCSQFIISDLNNKEIRELSEDWHKTLLDNPCQAKEDSDNACRIILQDSRITALARNPLLLTTLLFVKRWIGYLPTKKCQLYQEMIKLLLVSWNAAAHLKMDMEETEPQLAYVAYKMTKKGKQTIKKNELIQYIIEARKSLPEFLGYTKVSPSEFLNQVEERSSILIRQGLEEDTRGNLVQSYEFSHLSFQEYLTAKAISENWLPNNEHTDPLAEYLSILKDHYNENQWWEVIPLTAVLLKRQAKAAMKYLLEECNNFSKEKYKEDSERSKIMAFHLANCIACEVPLASDILNPALLAIANHSYDIERLNRRYFHNDFDSNIDVFKTIYNSEKYGQNLKNIVENELFENKDCVHFSELSNVWLKIHIKGNEKSTLQNIALLLNSSYRKDNISGALLMMHYAFRSSYERKRNKLKIQESNHLLEDIFVCIQTMLQEEDIVKCYVATWCISWAGYNEADIIPNDLIPTIFSKLIPLWCSITTPYDLKRTLSWAISTMCEKSLSIECTPSLSTAIKTHIEHSENKFDKMAALSLQLLLGEISIKNLDIKTLGIEKNRFLWDLGL